MLDRLSLKIEKLAISVKKIKNDFYSIKFYSSISWLIEVYIENIFSRIDNHFNRFNPK